MLTICNNQQDEQIVAWWDILDDYFDAFLLTVSDANSSSLDLVGTSFVAANILVSL